MQITEGQTSSYKTIIETNQPSTMLRHLGQNAPNNLASSCLAWIRFNSNTQLEAHRFNFQGANPVIISYEIIEYFPYIAKSCQNIYIEIPSGSSTVNKTINAVDLTKTTLIPRGSNIDGAATFESTLAYLEFLNSTTLRATRSLTSAKLTLSVTVFEFP